MLVYRCWGGQSTLWGNGFFSDQKPTSVLDAQLRFNIADWGNTIYFVSTFRVAPGVPYWIGSVFQHKASLARPGLQIFISPPLRHQAASRRRAGTPQAGRSNDRQDG